jgi:hypothetical protein
LEEFVIIFDEALEEVDNESESESEGLHDAEMIGKITSSGHIPD